MNNRTHSGRGGDGPCGNTLTRPIFPFWGGEAPNSPLGGMERFGGGARGPKIQSGASGPRGLFMRPPDGVALWDGKISTMGKSSPRAGFSRAKNINLTC